MPSTPQEMSLPLEDLIWVFDPENNRVIHCTPAYQAAWGRPLGELIQNPMDWIGAVHDEDRADVTAAIADCQRSGRLDIEFRVGRPSGRVRWVRARACPAPWAPGTRVMLGITEDVTTQRRLQAELRERDVHLRAALEAGHMSGWRVDLTTGLTDSTDRPGTVHFEELWAASIPPDELAAHRARVQEIVAHGGSFELEHGGLLPSGGHGRFVSRGRIVRDGDGRALAMVGATMDITALKAQEQALADALAEKDILIREVHHRVKNSLQIVSTFLLVQQMNVAEPAVRGLFAAAAERVHAVGRLHDLLCREGDAGRIELSAYLKLLVEDFVGASLNPDDASVSRRIEAGLEVSIDQASAVGIMLNELLTNAAKYGRTADGRCRLSVGAHRHGDEITLTVADKGPGFAGNPRATGGIGLSIVESMVRHLHGRMETRGDRGVHVRIDFPMGTGVTEEFTTETLSSTKVIWRAAPEKGFTTEAQRSGEKLFFEFSVHSVPLW